jgi:hypothetical protein
MTGEVAVPQATAPNSGPTMNPSLKFKLAGALWNGPSKCVAGVASTAQWYVAPVEHVDASVQPAAVEKSVW